MCAGALANTNNRSTWETGCKDAAVIDSVVDLALATEGPMGSIQLQWPAVRDDQPGHLGAGTSGANARENGHLGKPVVLRNASPELAVPRKPMLALRQREASQSLECLILANQFGFFWMEMSWLGTS